MLLWTAVADLWRLDERTDSIGPIQAEAPEEPPGESKSIGVSFVCFNGFRHELGQDPIGRHNIAHHESTRLWKTIEEVPNVDGDRELR